MYAIQAIIVTFPTMVFKSLIFVNKQKITEFAF